MDAPASPHVHRPVMLHRWEHVSFLHWRVAPDDVRRLLPAGLEVETFDGDAWVGLVPFRMARVRLPGLPPAPWLSRFPETNVRTYVRGPDGQAGIWFLSLDAARLPAVLAARATYGLPYFRASMAVRTGGALLRYRCRRRWPGPRGAGCAVTVEAGQTLDPGPLDHFLTARHVLYTVVAGRLAYAQAEHAPWPLTAARLVELEQDLVQAGGLPAPQGPPLVHHSPGVDVRIGPWRRVRA